MAELPRTMPAIRVEGGHGPASALVVTDLPVPRAGDGEVLIRVEAAGANRPDVFHHLGF